MKCIVSGGTGFIGGCLVKRLLQDNHYVGVYSRRPGAEARAGVASYYWDPLEDAPPEDSLNRMDAVIHLAGEPVAQRWNADVRRRIRDSRVLGTRNLVDALARTAHRPSVLVSASAIGIYGDRGDEQLTETSPTGTGFLADVCRAWEVEADRAAIYGVRVVKLRIGFVLGKGGGALGQMLPIFRLGLGGTLGFSGKQWMPWIHVDDLVEIVLHTLQHDVSGVWNATAPNPVTNRDFTRAMGRAVGRPAIFPAPVLALKAMFGPFAQHMLDSARVLPASALKAGFEFRYPEVDAALRDCVA